MHGGKYLSSSWPPALPSFFRVFFPTAYNVDRINAADGELCRRRRRGAARRPDQALHRRSQAA
eukprot:2142373-Pleurochrysis_carterae.AAC.3